MINWEYTDHFDYPIKLKERTNQIYIQFLFNKVNKSKIIQSILDTRSTHKFLFEGLTSSETKYFAGNYRGDNYQYLKDMQVSIGNDIAIQPPLVKEAMYTLSQKIEQGISKLDKIHKNPKKTEPEKSKRTVIFACEIFILFLKIHPYANGNGHIARYILISILKIYSYEITNFPLDPRPEEPTYTRYIQAYIAGNKNPLVKWVFQKIILPR